jgi:hypothetical protein
LVTLRLGAWIIVAALLLAPSALAGWMGKGGYEPDTRRDVTDGWMFLTPDTDPNQATEKVYFEGFFGACQYTGIGTCVSTSPNVAAIRSEFQFDQWAPFALLGVWKDCNKDGYIGLGEQGLWEYRSTLLLDTSVCPAQSTPIDPLTGKPPLNWFPSHNDGTWVREYLQIGWLNMASKIGDIDPWNVNDNGARVWLDGGLPESNQGGGGGCWIYPQPRGSFHSTGGLLWTGDCLDGYRITDTIDTVAALNPALSPLSFSDAPRNQYASHSLLNQPNPWGSESDPSDVQAWDCSKPQLVAENLGNGNNVNVSAPKVPPVVSTTGSPAGTANATGAGFDQCTRDTQGNGDLGDTLAHAPYTLEGGTNDVTYKIGTSNLQPYEDSRPPAPWSQVPTFGKSVPPTFGINDVPDTPLQSIGAGPHGLWSGNTITIGPATTTSYTTFYAYVSSAATYGLSLPKASVTGTYGAESCGSATSGIFNGWDCNANDWYKDATGRDNQPRSTRLGTDANGNGLPYGAFPGSPYNLRDINCIDQSFSPMRSTLTTTDVVNVVRSVQGEQPIAHCDEAP